MRVLRPAEARSDHSDTLELTSEERATLRKAAAIAETAAKLCEVDSDAWLDFKAIEHRCNEWAQKADMFAPFGVKVVARA